jgi:hypothetical protein
VIDRDVMASAVEDKMIHVFLTLLYQALVLSNFELNYSTEPLIIYFVKMRLRGKIGVLDYPWTALATVLQCLLTRSSAL